MSGMPVVGVCATREFLGARNLDDPVPSMECLPLDEALAKEWSTDAHMVQYQVSDSEAWPRCNKIVLGKLRSQGFEMHTTCLAFDWDTVGHVRLTPETRDEMVAKLVRAGESGLSLASDWTVAYTTRGGMRLIYVLARPEKVDEVEPWARAIVRDLGTHGIHMDPLHDWGRLFRLPRVVRDGKPSWNDSLFECILQPHKRLDLETLTKLDMTSVRTHVISEKVQELDIPMPDPGTCLDLLRESSLKSGNPIQTQWFKTAKARLRGRDCWSCIFDNKDIAPPGERHTTIFRYVGQAVGILSRVAGTTPELIFALFVEPGLRIDPRSCHRDPFETIWRAVLYTWAQQQARNDAEDLEREKAQAGKESVQLSVLMGMRSWCNASDLHGDDDDALGWMDQRLIACQGNFRYVMRRDGYYDSTPVPPGLLIPRIRELGMDTIMPIVTMDPKTSTWREVLPQTLTNRHGTIVNDIEGVAGTAGTTISDLGGKHPALQLRMYGLRTDLESVYSEHVDQWLHALGGDTNYQRLCDWLGLALDFRAGPICALSIQGPPSIGKGMLAQGLAECIDTGVLAGTHEFGAFQADLMRTPFLFVNEGFPVSSPGAKDPADTFRALVDGSPTKVRQLYQPIVTIRNPTRVIFAANNEDVVQMLAGHKDLTPEDQEALALRLFHFEAGRGAAEFLFRLGGFMHTGRPGHRWLRGPSGEASDFVLAQHFLWLYERRPPVPSGNRFLMEGQQDAEIVRRLSTRSGSAPDVIECLIKMIEAEVPSMDGLVIDDSRLFVTNSAVVDFYRATVGQKSRRVLSSSSVGNTLRSLLEKNARTHAFTLTTANGPRRTRWMQVDIRRLAEEAVNYGYSCRKLMRLVEGLPVGTPNKIGPGGSFS